MKRRLRILVVLWFALAASARAAQVGTTLFGLEPFDVGDPLSVEIRVRDNTTPIAHYALVLVFSSDILSFDPSGADLDLNTRDFAVTFEERPSTATTERRYYVAGEALNGAGGPANARVLTATFRVQSLGCSAAVRLEPSSPGAPILIAPGGESISTDFAVGETASIALLKSGDADNNGTLDARDAARIVDYLLGRQIPGPEGYRGDLTQDCAIDVRDVLYLKSRLR